VVHPQKDAAGKYFLLDGHLRLVALRELGETEADCIVANDDESFTYNARVNRLNPISEHKMIIKAVHNGVRPERICHQAEDHDAENPPQEDCLPIRATEALDQTERFLFEVDVNLLRGVMQQCLALLTWRQQEIFTMRYVDGLQPSDVARALGISPARVTQVLTESTAKIHAVFVKS
jgi:RNA polymerase sigma factor (sigma-70 family)